MRQSSNEYRLKIIIGVSLSIAVVILLRFTFIMLSPSRIDSSPSNAPVLSERGAIVDRNGRLIALQTRLWSVTAWKPEISDPVKTAEFLAPILELDKDTLSRVLADHSVSNFMFVKRQISPTRSDAVRKLINEGKLPGIHLQEELGRHYPMKTLAAPLIGHVGTDNTGLDGIEYAFDRTLSPGSISSDTNRLYGNTVHLTLDMNAQYLVERIADSAWQEHKPDSMMILVMDANTGEILSWISKPSYDPNTFTRSTRSQRMNRPIAMTYEPGSVFKVFTWSTFMEYGGIKVSDIFDTRNGYAPEIFKEYNIPPITDLANYGILNVEGALIHSSNVAVAMASESVSKQVFYKSLKNFGFGSPTGLPLPGESHGILNPVSKWSPRSKPTIAIGQEVGVSAVQITAAATALANSGVLLQPRIVSKVTSVDGNVVKEYPRTPVREVISPQTAETMLELMEKTVISPGGTSRRAAVPGLRISAKSGTAQITDPETGKYSKDRFLSSILGIFPTDNPKLIVYVVLENPQGGKIYGAQTAAPMLKQIAETLSPLYGIPIAGNTVVDHPGKVRVETPVSLPLGEKLHDLTGYSKKMLLPYLERKDIHWNIKGDGWVVYQFPPPGTPITSGMNIYVELK